MGRLVDVLGARHERRACLLDRRHDQDVVEPVPCEPVDLVNDHEVDVLQLFQSGEHGLECGAVGGLGAGSRVDELVDHLGSEGLGLANGRVALGWDRVALRFAT